MSNTYKNEAPGYYRRPQHRARLGQWLGDQADGRFACVLIPKPKGIPLEIREGSYADIPSSKYRTSDRKRKGFAKVHRLRMRRKDKKRRERERRYV